MVAKLLLVYTMRDQAPSRYESVRFRIEGDRLHIYQLDANGVGQTVAVWNVGQWSRYEASYED